MCTIVRMCDNECATILPSKKTGSGKQNPYIHWWVRRKKQTKGNIHNVQNYKLSLSGGLLTLVVGKRNLSSSGILLWSSTASEAGPFLSWSWCLLHIVPLLSRHTLYDTGPLTSTTSPPIHVGELLKFLTSTRSPGTKHLSFAWWSCCCFCLPWQSATRLVRFGKIKSNFDFGYLFNKRLAGDTPVVLCGVIP